MVSTTSTVKNTLAEARKPFYAYLGATDLAAAKVKDLPTAAFTGAGKWQSQLEDLQSQAQGQAKALQGQVKELGVTLSGQLNALPGKASAFYGELVTRGERRYAGRKGGAATAARTHSTSRSSTRSSSPRSTGARSSSSRSTRSAR